MTTATLTSATQLTTPDALDHIRDPDCNLAIWEREPVADMAALAEQMGDDVRFTCARTELVDHLEPALDAAGLHEGAARDALVDDVIGLAHTYCDVMRIAELEVRLERVTTNSCRKWHADYVTARLITTYAGTGTQWLAAREAERVKQGEEPERIGQLRVGDVGLFKGKLSCESPAIHRSPPIEGTDEVRLLLVLNPRETL